MAKKTTHKYQRFQLRKKAKVNAKRKGTGDRRIRVIDPTGKARTLYLHTKVNRTDKEGTGDLNIRGNTCPIRFKALGRGKYQVEGKTLASGEMAKNTPVLVETFGPSPWEFKAIMREKYIPLD